MAVNPIQVEKFLKGVDYPASKDELVRQAKKNGANDQIASTLEQLSNQQFDSPADVSKAIGKLNDKK